jgi:PhzF family phenazine biosynthesis protein
MKRFRFRKIDAFASGASGGNPAGCVYLDRAEDITPEEMQRIARELKGFVSEVVYLSPEGGAFLLRYYSSECEVDFCGHGTIAAMHNYISSDPELSRRPELEIVVRNERLKVLNRIPREGSVYISAPAPEHLETRLDRGEVARALETEVSAVAERRPIGFIRCGLAALIVPMSGLKSCLALCPPQETLRRFCLENGIDIVVVFSEETAFPEHGYRTRVFAPKFGYLEDPATGSGNSAFGFYLLKQAMWDGGSLMIEQGPDEGNPNIVRIFAEAGKDGPRVMFGGGAAVRIEGEYIL